MSLTSRSPASRKPFSLTEHDLNLTLPVTSREIKGTKRSAVSIGGEGLTGLKPNLSGGVEFQVQSVDEVSFSRRRSMSSTRHKVSPQILLLAYPSNLGFQAKVVDADIGRVYAAT